MSRITHDHRRCSRRAFMAGALAARYAAPCALAKDASIASGPDPKCPRCRGVGRVPLADAKPFAWLKSGLLPRWESAVGEQFCPICQPRMDPAALVAEFKQAADAALEKHRQWEERTGWKLACLITRHAVVHTQLSTAQARAVGAALETLTLHLNRITDSLVLTPTRPDALELMLLWEKPSWDQFRKVMENLYTLEELGGPWASARLYNAYDHIVTPHTYETPQSIRTRPPTCGAVFIAARRQIDTATERRSPFWLSEGFSAYGDHAVHKVNRWYTVYDVKQIPVGDWLADARKLAASAKHRPWNKMIERELRDWEAEDHVQTMAMVVFLLESQPAKFLDLIARIKNGENQVSALEEAYHAKLDDLEQLWLRWLLAGR